MITKKYIRDNFNHIPLDTPLYNSDYNAEAIKIYLDGISLNISVLDPIITIYENDGECEFGGDDFILILRDLYEISENFEGEIALNRDVEDGFVYSNYKNWTYYKNKLIFH